MADAAIVWLIAAAIFCILEGMTVSLVSIWMAVSAAITAGVAILGGSIMAQILSFLIFSVVLLLATIPFSKRFRSKKREKTNADRIIDAEAVVIERIDPIYGRGKIRVMGQFWSASDIQCSSVEVGEKVIVRSIEGVRAIVEKI